MGGSTGSLGAAVKAADDNATVLDDRIDAEDHAAFLWMRAHQLRGYAHHSVAVGTELLPAAWAAQKKKFINKDTALTYLQHFAKNHSAMVSIQALAQELSPGGKSQMTDIEELTILANALATDRAWLIELPKRDLKSRFISKTSPAAFAPLNPKYGTKVDFDFIASLEGNQWLRGYVPMKNNVVIGKSGMTVGSGFDLGQWSTAELSGFGFPQALLNKITPFASPHRFKGMTKKQVAAEVVKLGPVPELTKAEADLCDGAVFSKILGEAINAWNSEADKGVPKYVALPGGWQTVWLSRFYQEGSSPRSSDAIAFRDAATSGKWQDAIAKLKAYKEYTSRANQEAALLSKEVPPAVGPPAKPPAK